jgi:hypothetical protein
VAADTEVRVRERGGETIAPPGKSRLQATPGRDYVGGVGARTAPDDLSEELLRKGVELMLVGRGRSMWPVIAPGDRIVARACAGPPRSGEIVVLRTPAGIVTHRLIARRGDPPRLVTRGDWLDHDDAPVPEGALLGVVHRVIKRRVRLELGTPVGASIERVLYVAGWLLRQVRGLVRR